MSNTRIVYTTDLETGKTTIHTEEFTPPIPDPIEQRREAYRLAFTMDELMEALFEDKEGRPEKLQALQAKREAIKAQYPKDKKP